MIVLDTNVLLELMKPEPAADVASWVARHSVNELCTTVITEAEVLAGIEILAPGKRRDRLRAAAEAAFEHGFNGRVLPFDSAAAREYAMIMARRRRIGRPLSHADGQIAAIAQLHGATVATRDTADFEGCGIEIIDPWHH